MKRNIIVKQDEFETMVAILEDDRLAEVFVEREYQQGIAGNVYKARVENVLPGMQAAFVDFGEERNGFLHIRDVVAHKLDADGKLQEPDTPINRLLRPGQEIMVQVVKEPTGNKGARLSMNPTLPGRYLVLLPTTPGISISRRIEDETLRARLPELVKSQMPEGMGAIIRTAAADATEEAVINDIKGLLKLWKWLLGKNAAGKAVSLLYQDQSLLRRVVRDTFYGDLEHIYVNSAQTAANLAEVVQAIAPEYLPEICQPGRDVMAIYNVEAQLEQALAEKVWLKCGGYLIIQHLEAFTIIDVNTGKFVGNSAQTFADVVLRTNLEAAEEVARQLQLRNIGGIIIVDFIDMKDEAEQEQILAKLNGALAGHRVKTNVLGFTQLGLVEMTRKKNGHTLQELFERPCPHCHGKGSVASEESVFVKILGELADLAGRVSEPAIYIETNPVISSYIIGPAGETKARLEKRFDKKLVVRGNAELKMTDYVVREFLGNVAELDKSPFEVGQLCDCFLCEKHSANKDDAICRMNGYVILVAGGADFVGQKRLLRVTEVHNTFACAEFAD